MTVMQAQAPAIKPQGVVTDILRHVANKLKVPTIVAGLPFAGNPAAMQAGAVIRDALLPIAEAVEKAASDLAEYVNSLAIAMGATHVSFEQLPAPPVDNWHSATDSRTGISVRMIWAADISTGEILTRFEVCYRLWKLLPSALPEGA